MARELRAGMWVKSKAGRVGILFKNDIKGLQFHEVDKNGETTLEVPANLTDYVQAAYEEIPEKRRMSKDMAIGLGYLKQQ